MEVCGCFIVIQEHSDIEKVEGEASWVNSMVFS